MKLAIVCLLLAYSHSALASPSLSSDEESLSKRGEGSCDPIFCDFKCKEIGNESGYCGTGDPSLSLLGLQLVSQELPQCICVPKPTTTTCTTTTATATETATATVTDCTATVTATPTATVCFCCSSPNQPGTGLQGSCDLATDDTCTNPGNTNRFCCTQDACVAS